MPFSRPGKELHGHRRELANQRRSFITATCACGDRSEQRSLPRPASTPTIANVHIEWMQRISDRLFVSTLSVPQVIVRWSIAMTRRETNAASTLPMTSSQALHHRDHGEPLTLVSSEGHHAYNFDLGVRFDTDHSCLSSFSHKPTRRMEEASGRKGHHAARNTLLTHIACNYRASVGLAPEGYDPGVCITI